MNEEKKTVNLSLLRQKHQANTRAPAKKEKKEKTIIFCLQKHSIHQSSRTLKYYPIYNIMFRREKTQTKESVLLLFSFSPLFIQKKKERKENNHNRCCMCDKREKTGCENDKKNIYIEKDGEYYRTS